MRIITGADAPFFRSLCQLLLSARRHGVLDRCHVYDLGLTSDQVGQLARLFPALEVRTFDFGLHPAHVAMAAGSYAWKPVIVAQALEEGDGPVLWLDAATLLLSDLAPIEQQIRAHGQYVPYSGPCDVTVQRWTHPGTLARLRIGPSDPLMHARQRAGGVCGFDGGVPVVRELVRRWREFALDAGCIVPAGCSRENHRHDQSLLTLLLCTAERDEGLTLTHDEVDLNSARPIPWLSVRRKVAAWMPIALDPLVWRYYYWLHHRMCTFRFRWFGR